MNAEQLAAAQNMHRALSLMPCGCQHNVPYAGGQVEQVITVMCARCRAMKQWDQVTSLTGESS